MSNREFIKTKKTANHPEHGSKAQKSGNHALWENRTSCTLKHRKQEVFHIKAGKPGNPEHLSTEN